MHEPGVAQTASSGSSKASDETSDLSVCTQVLIKRRKRGRGGVDSWEVVRARGHLDEVQELKSGEAAQALAQGRPSKESMQLVLTEGAVLGGGAFSRVSIVTGD